MIPIQIKVALHSVVAGLTVALRLYAFRIRNGFAPRDALGLVLAAAWGIVLLMPVTDRLHFEFANSSIVRSAHPMTLLQELQAIIQARSGSGLLPRPFEPAVPTTNSPQAENSRPPIPNSEPATDRQKAGPSSAEPDESQAESITKGVGADKTQPAFQLDRVAFSPSASAFWIFVAAGVVLLQTLAFALSVSVTFPSRLAATTCLRNCWPSHQQ